jgi:hypothetical protein
MSCPAFGVDVKDVKAALAKVKKGISEKKGTFSGDETKGSYNFSGDHWIAGKYTIQGSYSVAGNTITVTNTITAEKPDLVTCKRVSDEVKDWLT